MAATAPGKSTTLHDVAREAGVSLITASRALGNPGVVSGKTIARVLEAVERTGYIPNLLAGGLKSRRSMTVAGLVPVISVPQFLPTVRALTETLDAQGYQLILGQSGYDHSREEKLLNTILSRRPDKVAPLALPTSHLFGLEPGVVFSDTRAIPKCTHGCTRHPLPHAGQSQES